LISKVSFYKGFLATPTDSRSNNPCNTCPWFKGSQILTLGFKVHAYLALGLKLMHIWPWVVHNFVYHIYVFLKIYFICFHSYLAWVVHNFVYCICVFFKLNNLTKSLSLCNLIHLGKNPQPGLGELAPMNMLPP